MGGRRQPHIEEDEEVVVVACGKKLTAAVGRGISLRSKPLPSPTHLARRCNHLLGLWWSLPPRCSLLLRLRVWQITAPEYIAHRRTHQAPHGCPQHSTHTSKKKRQEEQEEEGRGR